MQVLYVHAKAGWNKCKFSFYSIENATEDNSKAFLRVLQEEERT